jgi:hypothetical protein
MLNMLMLHSYYTRCYLLGLAPNAARLSVRFWHVSSFGDVLEKVARHYTDMDIAGIERLGGTISPWRTLKLKHRLEKIIDPEKDSIRCYFLGNNWKNRVEHIGAKSGYDPEGIIML